MGNRWAIVKPLVAGRGLVREEVHKPPPLKSCPQLIGLPRGKLTRHPNSPAVIAASATSSCIFSGRRRARRGAAEARPKEREGKGGGDEGVERERVVGGGLSTSHRGELLTQ